MVTILAVMFLALTVVLAVAGYRVLGKRTESPGTERTERCALCRNRFSRELLVERQIGDYKLMYFCRQCVLGLYSDLGLKN